MTTLTLTYDAEYETWDLAEDGAVVESFETEAEALAARQRMADEAEVERLADALVDAIEKCRQYGDLEALRRTAAWVGV